MRDWIVVWMTTRNLHLHTKCSWMSRKTRWYPCVCVSVESRCVVSCESGSLGVEPQGGWYIASVTKYRCESDSVQVPWGKDEKNSEKRVQSVWNCWKGSDSFTIVFQNLFFLYFYFIFVILYCIPRVEW